MVSYPERDIATNVAGEVPLRLLQSIFSLEVLRPSRGFWLCSPWVSDIAVIDNRARQFATVAPDWPAAEIRLATVLETLVERGGRVTVIVNTSPHNDAFRERLAPLLDRFGGALRLRREALLHQKGMLGDHFVLDGSMNFTYHGVYRNEEHLIYRTDPAVVAARRLAYEERWGAPS